MLLFNNMGAKVINNKKICKIFCLFSIYGDYLVFAFPYIHKKPASFSRQAFYVLS